VTGDVVIPAQKIGRRLAPGTEELNCRGTVSSRAFCLGGATRAFPFAEFGTRTSKGIPPRSTTWRKNMVIASVVLTPTFASTREALAFRFGSIRAVMNAVLLMAGVRPGANWKITVRLAVPSNVRKARFASHRHSRVGTTDRPSRRSRYGDRRQIEMVLASLADPQHAEAVLDAVEGDARRSPPALPGSRRPFVHCQSSCETSSVPHDHL
jgi:hypothetical protein